MLTSERIKVQGFDNQAREVHIPTGNLSDTRTGEITAQSLSNVATGLISVSRLGCRKVRYLGMLGTRGG